MKRGDRSRSEMLDDGDRSICAAIDQNVVQYRRESPPD